MGVNAHTSNHYHESLIKHCPLFKNHSNVTGTIAWVNGTAFRDYFF